MYAVIEAGAKINAFPFLLLTIKLKIETQLIKSLLQYFIQAGGAHEYSMPMESKPGSGCELIVVNLLSTSSAEHIFEPRHEYNIHAEPGFPL